MAHQSLYRRYRPRRFAEVLGQEHPVQALRNAVASGAVGHAYLLSGPRGTGKTSSARILAKALNCAAPIEGEPCLECASCLAVEAGTSVDLHEHDAASRRGINEMRDMLERVSLGTAGNFKVYILDEVHMLTKEASGALLKSLEEPPEHVVWVLATTDPEKVLPTIRSRTQHFEFGLLPPDVLEKHVREVVADAGLDVADESIGWVVRQAKGSARDALSALDRVAAAGGVPTGASLDAVIEALAERDAGAAVSAFAELVQAGRDPQQLAYALVADLRDAFLSLMAPDLVAQPEADRQRLADVAERMKAPAITRALESLGDTLVALKDAPEPRVLVEVALVRLCRSDVGTDPAALAERITRLEAALQGGVPTVPAAPAGESPAAAVTEAPAAAAPPTGPVDEAPPAAGPSSRGGSGVAGARAALAETRKGVPAPPASPRSKRAARSRPADGPEATAGPGAGPARPAASTPQPGPRADETEPAPPNAAPAEPQSSEPQPAAAGGGALPDRDALTLAWGDRVMGTLSRRAKARFSAGRFSGVADGVALFALPNQMHRERCEECRPEVEAALAQHFGVDVPLRLVVDDDPGDPGGRPSGPGAATRTSQPAIEEDETDIVVDELEDAPDGVASGIDAFTEAFPGAEVVDQPGD